MGMLPEAILIIVAFIIILMEIASEKSAAKIVVPLALAGLGLSLLSVIDLMPGGVQMFGGEFVVDPIACWFKFLLLVCGVLSVSVSSEQLSEKGNRALRQCLAHRSEFLVILLLNLVGMMFLVSMRNMVTLYVCLELATIPLYLLVAWRKHVSDSVEAAMKYVVLGVVSSGLMLFGLSLIYGLSGTLQLDHIAANLDSAQPAFWLALGMILAGVGFKLTLVPFHFWAAEVYAGSATPVTAYLSVASKCAGLAFLFQFFYRALGEHILELGDVIAWLAAITMTVGNVAAIVQQNIKRFMAFSAISQAGYLLMGFLSVEAQAPAAMIYYMFIYILANMAVFGVIIFYANATDREQINDYRGLSQTSPLIALVMMLSLFSLAGIPPLAGFTGKFILFNVAASQGHYLLVGVASVNSTISLYYYLRIIRQMYIEPPVAGDEPGVLKTTALIRSTLVLTTIGVSALGILPVIYTTIFNHLADWKIVVTGG